MPITPNKSLLDRTSRIEILHINGEDWPVPPLAPKQNEIVVPTVLDLWPLIERLREADNKFAMLHEIMGTENLKRLYDCVFLALQRGHPDLTREEFDSEFSVGALEALEAITPISKAAGILKVANASAIAAASAPTGEAAAPAPQTGAN